MKALIVDDERPIRNIVSRTLRGLGWTTDEASCGEDAVARLAEGWDIVFTDIMMPGEIDGLGVLERVMKAGGGVDVIMMTGYPETRFAIEALKLGAYDFIVKPFTPDVIQAAAGRCALKRRLSAELAREKVKDRFGSFLSNEVVDYVLTLPEGARRHHGELKRVTVLFADVRRFTPFAEASRPQVAVERLNEIFTYTCDAVQRQGGIVNKFVGDGLLALFGAPVALDGHESAAARAALEAMESIERLAERSDRPPLRVGVGINSGQVIAGCLGTAERTEYGVIGHAVNLAARLEKSAEPGQILLGSETARALGPAFSCRNLGPRSFHGIARLEDVFELVQKRPAAIGG